MPDPINSDELYHTLLRKLKQAIYYEPDLNQQIAFAKYETDKKTEKIVTKIIELLQSENNPNPDEVMKLVNPWIEQISFHYQPKKVDYGIPEDYEEYTKNPKEYKNFKAINHDDEKCIFSNITNSAAYLWEDVNYVFDIPIPLLILDVWWCSQYGVYFDTKLSESCYGNRLYLDKTNNLSNNNTRLFKKYIDQYNSWRKNAVTAAKNALKEEKYVTIFSLDISKYYYSVDIDFEKVSAEYYKEINTQNNIPRNSEQNTFECLTRIIKLIHEKCTSLYLEYANYTHNERFSLFKSDRTDKQNKILPIGLFSSKILANWYLIDFDKELRIRLKPNYYGRYVDDMLIVLTQSKYNKLDIIYKYTNTEFKASIDKCFVNNGLFTKSEDSNQNEITYYISVDRDDQTRIYPEKRLSIQNTKIKRFQFDPEFSDAALELLEKNIKDTEKAFLYLPDEDLTASIQDKVYSLIFEDKGMNKIRSVERVAINPTALSILLAQQSFNIRICGKPAAVSPEFLKKLLNDVKGLNYLEYQRTWEKIFTLLVLSGKQELFKKTYDEIKETIGNLRPDKKIRETNSEDRPDAKNQDNPVPEALNQKVISDVTLYLDYSAGIALSLLSLENRKKYIQYPENNEIDESDSTILESAKEFRNADMFRHHHIAYPLLNYLEEYEGDLCCVNVFSQDFSISTGILQSYELDTDKIQKSPRFIHIHEFQLFYAWQYLKKTGSFIIDDSNNYINTAENCYTQKYTWLSDTLIKYETPSAVSNISSAISVTPKQITIAGDNTVLETVKVGLSNLWLTEKWIEDNIKYFGVQNLSIERWHQIANLLNAAVSNKCNLLILPECAIPAKWLSSLALWSKEHQIGLIFGMEHIISDSVNEKETSRQIAYNVTVAILPYQVNNLYKSCCVSMRLKNHYSPGEKKLLLENNYSLPNPDHAVYNLYNWRGNQFSIYNCFELADIQQRAIFKSHIDFMIACSFNKDTAYFYDIIESTARDLHCYIVYSNTAKYGCSKVVQPKKSEYRDLLTVGGGKNPALLVSELDIKALSEFQCKNHLFSPITDSDTSLNTFKPVPPGFNTENVQNRHERGRRNTKSGKKEDVQTRLQV